MRVRIIGDRDFVARKNRLYFGVLSVFQLYFILFFIMFNLILYLICIPATFCAERLLEET